MSKLWFWLFWLMLAMYISCNARHAYGCDFSWCAEKGKTKRTNVTDTRRKVVGDIYDPGVGRVQLRDRNRRSLGYIKKDGAITNTRRQWRGRIEK